MENREESKLEKFEEATGDTEAKEESKLEKVSETSEKLQIELPEDDDTEATSDEFSEEYYEEHPEEKEINWDLIETDDKGIPVLNQDDVEKLSFFLSTTGIVNDNSIVVGQIQNLLHNINRYLELKDLSDEEKEQYPEWGTMVTEESYKNAMDTLASIQIQARSKDTEQLHETMKIYNKLDRNLKSFLNLGSAFGKAIKTNNPYLAQDKELTTKEIFAKENYFSIFSKIVRKTVEEFTNTSDKTKLFKKVMYSESIDDYHYNYQIIFSKLFQNYASEHVMLSSVLADQDFTSLLSYLDDFNRVLLQIALVESEEVRKFFFENIYIEKTSTLQTADEPADPKEAFIEKIKNALTDEKKGNKFYQEIKAANDEETIKRIINIVLSQYSIISYLHSEETRSKLEPTLIKFRNGLINIIKSIIKKYNVRKIEISDKDLSDYAMNLDKLLVLYHGLINIGYEENEYNANVNTLKQLKETYGFTIDETAFFASIEKRETQRGIAQIDYDKFSYTLKCDEELLRNSLIMYETITHYFSEKTYQTANSLFAQLLCTYTQNNILDAFYSYFVNPLSSPSDIVALWNLDIPLKEVDVNASKMDIQAYNTVISNENDIVSITFKDILYSLNQTLVSANNTDYLGDLYELYETSSQVSEEYKLPIFSYFYEKNDVQALRKDIFEDILVILETITNSINNITSINMVEEMEKIINDQDNKYKTLQEERQKYLRNRRKSKKARK